MKKFLSVPLVEFLQSVVDENTKHYGEDFELDKEKFSAALEGSRGGQTFLWMSRENGTHCVREYEAFIKDSDAHTTWKYYEGAESERIRAFTVELCGVKNGVSYGNVYELDYQAHVAELKRKSVLPLEIEKVFEDGHVEHVPYEKSSYGYYYDLVEKHGTIVDSLWVPQDEYALKEVLSEQKRQRDKFPLAKSKKFKSPGNGLVDDLLVEAKEKSKTFAADTKSSVARKKDERGLD